MTSSDAGTILKGEIKEEDVKGMSFHETTGGGVVPLGQPRIKHFFL
jgi:hypothetical protein